MPSYIYVIRSDKCVARALGQAKGRCRCRSWPINTQTSLQTLASTPGAFWSSTAQGMRVLVCVSNARELLTGGWLAALKTG